MSAHLFDRATRATEALALVAACVDADTDQLIEFRRDLHAHPELSWGEERTTARVLQLLQGTPWRVHQLERSGLIAELGDGEQIVGLRADLDALPVDDLTTDPWCSTAQGIAHACGHDVHTTALAGAGLALARVHAEGRLNGRVRLFFQPAEEVMPGGADHVLEAGALVGVHSVFALHCDPTLDVGQVGLRVGPLTGAADAVRVRLFGNGGHTSRPHLTEDLTFALGKLITELPAALSRRMDPRAGVSVVWGMVEAGSAHNVIPDKGYLAGTIRMLDSVAWADSEEMVRELVAQIIAPYGVTSELAYVRGVPPVVNSAGPVAVLSQAVESLVGADAAVMTSQSLGGEDFAWYLAEVPGAMGRLGTRTPGGETFDLHQGNLRIDERAIAIGAKVLAGAALLALSGEGC